MISLDTNALIRLVIEDDDPEQSARMQKAVLDAQSSNTPVLILDAVVLEAIWVLNSVYKFKRDSIAFFVESLLYSDVYHFSDRQMIQIAAMKTRQGGDFSDIFFALSARKMGAKSMLSFDRKFQKLFPDFVREP